LSDHRDRDERLGAALRQLEPPEHRPGFWEELETRLADEPRPAVRRRARRRTWALAAAVAAAAAVLGLVFGVPRTNTPQPAPAAIVKQRVADAIRELESLQAHVWYRSRTRDAMGTARYRIVLSSTGDFRVTRLGGGALEDTAYNALTGTQRSISPSASIGTGRFYTARHGLPPGPPDAGPDEPPIERDLGSAMRALLAARDPRIEDTTYDGRKAWRVRLPVEPNLIPYAADVDRIDVTVDQQTGLPLRVRRTLRGRLRSELRVSGLTVNGQLPPNAFEIRFTRGADVLRTDGGFRRVALDRVVAMVGYSPLLATRLPDGYTLSEVAVARRPALTGAEGANPPSRGVVSLSYRRGFDQVIVTNRLARAFKWSDPFAVEGVPEPRQRLRLTSGAFAGAGAEVVVGPRSVPHLWGQSDELVTTISGDLTRNQLLDAANSLSR
jgi:outer membrane lipoprotein-sorting protein